MRHTQAGTLDFALEPTEESDVPEPHSPVTCLHRSWPRCLYRESSSLELRGEVLIVGLCRFPGNPREVLDEGKSGPYWLGAV